MSNSKDPYISGLFAVLAAIIAGLFGLVALFYPDTKGKNININDNHGEITVHMDNQNSAKEGIINWSVTKKSICGLTLDMDIEQVYKIFNPDKYIYKFWKGTPNSDNTDSFTIIDRNSNEELLWIECRGGEHCGSFYQITALSKKIKTYNQVFPGLQIDMFLNIYQGDMNLCKDDYTETEYFELQDLSVQQTKIIATVSSNVQKRYFLFGSSESRMLFLGNYHNENDCTWDFSRDGFISSISLIRTIY